MKEAEKLNVLIRKAYKLALGRPDRTPTERLLRRGIHCTWEELVKAHVD